MVNSQVNGDSDVDTNVGPKGMTQDEVMNRLQEGGVLMSYSTCSMSEQSCGKESMDSEQNETSEIGEEANIKGGLRIRGTFHLLTKIMRTTWQ